MSPPLRTPSLLAVAALVLASTVSACGGDEPPAGPTSVQVETSDWNGWQESEQPALEVTTVEVTTGSTFAVDAADGPVEFTVADMDGSRIELESDRELVVVSSDGGLDFDEATRSFTLTPDEDLALGTPTMDAGTTVTLSVVS